MTFINFCLMKSAYFSYNFNPTIDTSSNIVGDSVSFFLPYDFIRATTLTNMICLFYN